MNEITHINQTQQSIRILSIGSHSFFIEDWNKNQPEIKLKTIQKNKK